ncbi:hypothetical protein [Mesorhizobium sp. ES1-4]|uniref:hypothetical protein n=1 Tax=Mesorhizobium sp. ES1-4 TaxID=2876627 RepID=UPI001CCD051D|nr:hypothetical protein [Mesorhizobium sp. ES1-4]MBZ9799711.1 hypothetical protein [Mesorhizobium sp. ES1-4]
MRIDMAEVAGAPILSGAINGKAAFAEFVKMVDGEPNEPSPLFLDFRNIDVATASYLRESVFALKTYMRTRNSRYYPVVTNINNLVADELSVIATLKNDVIMSCQIDENRNILTQEIIGTLDPKQKMTFDLVMRSKEIDANRLMEQFGESEKTKGTTAWNNRLSGLVSKGIIREFVQGRAKVYRPLFEGGA